MTDGYNTEATERRHIDLAKYLYCASNKKEYIKQITESLQRHEQMLLFKSYIWWRSKDNEVFSKYVETGDFDNDFQNDKDKEEDRKPQEVR